MTEPLTRQRLAEIGARLSAATLGPWHQSEHDPLEVWADRDPAGWDAFWIATTRSLRNSPPELAVPNAELIAHAPADLRALLAEVRRQREALDNVRALHFDMGGGYCDVCEDDRGPKPFPCPTARALGES